MTVLEVALVPYKQTLSKEAIEAAWKEPEKTLTAAPGLKVLYTGFVPTHPGLFSVFIIWDSIHSHHKLEHSPAYGPFVQGVLPILAGDIDIVHFEIDSDAVSLKKALSMPCTQMSHLSIKKGKAADFLKAYYESFEKYVVGEKYHGMWMRYPYEEPFSFYAFLGWQNEQDHYDVMKGEKYLQFRDSFKDCVRPEKGVKIYHMELKKIYGDW